MPKNKKNCKTCVSYQECHCNFHEVDLKNAVQHLDPNKITKCHHKMLGVIAECCTKYKKGT